MSTVTYQPSYSTSKGGRFGFRYLAQPPAPNITKPGIPPNQTVDSSQATPSKTMGSGANMQDPFVGDSDFEFASSGIPAAQSLGYTQGTQSLLNAIPVVGTIARMTGYEAPTDTYGDYGTYDSQGNVFGNEGRAYDPVTGSAANSYAKPSDWYGSYLGIGTEDGFLGPSSSYGKLRAAGENIPSSLLGSYENSVHNVPRVDRMYGLSPASKAGLDTIGTRGRKNAAIMGIEGYRSPDVLEGYSDDDLDRYDPVTAEELKFTDARPAPQAPRLGKEVGYLPGTQVGDMFTSPNSYQTGVINKSGQIETPTGTTVQMKDAFGTTQSFLNKDPAKNLANIQNVKASFDAQKDYSDNTPDGISDTSISTDSDGNVTATSNVTGETVTSAYNQIPDELQNPSTDGTESGGKG